MEKVLNLRERQLTILETVLTEELAGNTFVSMYVLIEKNGVSERTIRNDIKIINNEIKQMNMKILNKRNIGYFIEHDNRYELIDLLNLLAKPNEFSLENNTDRIKSLMMNLLYAKSYQTMEELADSIYVSTNTIYTYLNELEPIFEPYNLELVSKSNFGIKIVGEELEKQNLIFDYIIDRSNTFYSFDITPLERYFFSNNLCFNIFEIVRKIIIDTTLVKNDVYFKNFVIRLIILIHRKKNNFVMTTFVCDLEFQNLNSDEIILKNIIEHIEDSEELTFSREERLLIKHYFILEFRLFIDTKDDVFTNVLKLIDEMLLFINDVYLINLRKNEDLTNNLIKHILPIVRNKKIYKSTPANSLEIKNLVDTFYYNIVESAIKNSTSPLKVFFDQTEIAYLSFYIGSAFEQQINCTRDPIKTLLVCGSGKATAGFIEIRLKKELGDLIHVTKRISVQDFINNKENLKQFDLIISTVPLEEASCPVPIMNLSLDDFNNDIKKIKENNAFYSNDFLRFFDQELFFKFETINKKDALAILSKNLYANNFTTTNIFNDVIHREKIKSTRMTNIAAIPHPVETSAKETKIGVLISEKGIVWDDEGEINLILLLSINEKEPFLELFYDNLISLLQDQHLQERLITAQDFPEFLYHISVL